MFYADSKAWTGLWKTAGKPEVAEASDESSSDTTTAPRLVFENRFNIILNYALNFKLYLADVKFDKMSGLKEMFNLWKFSKKEGKISLNNPYTSLRSDALLANLCWFVSTYLSGVHVFYL